MLHRNQINLFIIAKAANRYYTCAAIIKTPMSKDAPSWDASAFLVHLNMPGRSHQALEASDSDFLERIWSFSFNFAILDSFFASVSSLPLPRSGEEPSSVAIVPRSSFLIPFSSRRPIQSVSNAQHMWKGKWTYDSPPCQRRAW